MFKRKVLVLIVLTIIFSIVIFFIKMYFFSGVEESIEEEYIDRSLYISLDSSKKEDIDKKNIIVNEKKELKEEVFSGTVSKKVVKTYTKNYTFTYIPRFFEKESITQTNILENIISSSYFNYLVDNLGIELYKSFFDVRGKMKNGKVKLFGVPVMKNPELVSVFVHELAHFIDIYYLNSDNSDNKDYSHYFYNIAWESTKTIKSDMTASDFVSGYSMTNKYEDFAETFTYYVLHNEDFREKASESKIMKNKYDYFGKYLFKNKEFIFKDFGKKEKIKDYYWDITKIDINLENFLQYFKNAI